jgi:peptide-methionine (R)-S-oxide reductase
MAEWPMLPTGKGAVMQETIRRSDNQETIRRSDSEWRQMLTTELYRITRLQGTEPPCSGRYHDFHGVGVYRCACCGFELFSSREKSPLPEKWPTFRAPITEERITTAPHIDHFMVRTAVKCGRCDAHLGFLFPDRKPPAWKRYVVNSIALTFHDDRRQGIGQSAGASGGTRSGYDRAGVQRGAL